VAWITDRMASVATPIDVRKRESVRWCDGRMSSRTSGASVGIYYHAASWILSVRTMGDRAQGLAEITTVARQTSDSHDHWTARYAIREDTARWVLVRRASTGGRWKVSGDAHGGFGVTHIGRDIVWAEGSRAKALAAVDSIRRARRLDLLR
jgi:hypothetical protein